MESLSLSLTLEQVTAAYFDAAALRAQPLTLYRIDGGDSRYYYEPDTRVYRVSVTSLSQATLPTPYPLIRWMVSLGPDYKKIRDGLAAYGTWLHLQFQELLISGHYDFGAMAENLATYAALHGYRLSDTDWLSLARQDVLSLAAFIREKNVKPLAVETILATADYAGALDLVCEMDVEEKGFFGEVYAGSGKYNKKGDPKESKRIRRAMAIVDLKSRRSGFYLSDEVQLHMYRRAWDENYPDTPIEFLFNLGMTDWRTAPKFSLENQTDKPSVGLIDNCIANWKILGKAEPTPSLVVSGYLTPEKSISDCYSFMTMQDILDENAEKPTP